MTIIKFKNGETIEIPCVFPDDIVKPDIRDKVTGRLMSRDVYVNGEETESVYEISVKEMEKLEDEE